MATLAIGTRDGSLCFRVKVVPGASRDRVVGPFGDALKVQVAAPPEGGKANRRLVEVLAQALGVGTRDVEVVQGHGHAQKVVAVRGLDEPELRRRLGL